MKKIGIFISCILLIIATVIMSSCNEVELLKRDDWEDSVKENLNSLIKKYKNDGNYAVFDFDNTTCIFDIEEQLIVYQLETMSFELNPNELKAMLMTGLSTTDPYINKYGYFEDDDRQMTYSDLVDDIYNAYLYLFNNYGEFSYLGLSSEKQEEIQNTNEHKEFKTKMRMMYDLACDKETTEVSYPWITYWFSGMTEEELYKFSYRSHEYYSKVETEKVTWHTDGNLSKTGAVSIEWTKGIRVSDNLVELYKCLTNSGIDVWVCSASSVDVVRAAVDYFGLHDYCKGVIGMTNKIVDSKYISEYDYVNGVGYYTKENNGWEKMTTPIKTQTQAEGKVTAINNVLVKEYNKGPIAGFGDSTGDFNFCSEFDSLKLVVYFNRANRKPTDGGGLIAPLAMYQKEVLKYNLYKANKNNDTLYLLQGRDERGLRTLRNSNKTILVGTDSEKLYKNDNNLLLFNYFRDNKMTTEDIINKFSVVPTNNVFSFDYGFFESYSGYHSIKDNN